MLADELMRRGGVSKEIRDACGRAYFGGQMAQEGGGEMAVSADPWVHRSSRMRCETCMWFVLKQSHYPPGFSGEKPPEIGRCRRHAPTLAGYPVVYPLDWCGDHKLDETKAAL